VEGSKTIPDFAGGTGKNWEKKPSVRIFCFPADIRTLYLYQTNSRTPKARCQATRRHNPKDNSMCRHSKWGQEIRSDTQCRVRYLAVITCTTLMLGDARRHVLESGHVSFWQFTKQNVCDSNSKNMFSPLKHEIYVKSFFKIQMFTSERPLQVRYEGHLRKDVKGRFSCS
jgi:hypothetical protein